MSGPPVIWQPQPGSQTLFLNCPVREILYQGTRGPGKTDALLMKFAQNVGRGWGGYWRGIVFRREYKELDDVVTKSKRWFRQIFPGAQFLASKADYRWVWPDGEELLFRTMKNTDDYWNYHGHEYPFIGWEELCAWPNPDCYEIMRSTNRTSNPDVEVGYYSTANPYGPGHHWVKDYYIDKALPGRIIRTGDRPRVHIFGSIAENRFLNDDYIQTLRADRDPDRRKAWLFGSWDIALGGRFEGAWDANTHVLDPFIVPKTWYVDRAFDWGSSKPYAVGIFAESDGEPFDPKTGEPPKDENTKTLRFPRGSTIMVGEVYGYGGSPNVGTKESNREIAMRVKAHVEELQHGILKHHRQVWPGPADSSIFDDVNGDSYAREMGRYGLNWKRGFKGAGSRVAGWERIFSLLEAARDEKPERPGLWVFSTCQHWIRTVPSLTRDKRKPDDVDTEQEDHAGDMTRYRVLRKPRGTVKTTELGWVN